MSIHSAHEIRQVEEMLDGVIRSEFDSKSAELRDADLHVEIDPVCRSGEGPSYVSYIEATLRYKNGDVHDVVFLYVAREGRLVVDPASTPLWMTRTIDEALRKASGDKPSRPS